MTLHKQLFLFTVFLVGILFLGVWLEKLQSTRSFLVTQLESHAQDTATSLGLSLSPIMAENDLPTVETMINAVFDRGYYRVISLKDTNGEVITDRILTVEIDGVPNWFINFISIEAPRAEALVMAGWSQAGTLYVESHPGFAYQTIWDTMSRISLYFLIAGSTILLFGSRGLRLLLKPLKRVEQQAEAICRKEYQIQDTLPKTRELRQVVVSMNRMTTQVKEMFSRQTKVAERLRQKAYRDQVTGLGNRRYMNAQVEARLEVTNKDIRGAFLMLHIDNLQKVNEIAGYEAGDALLQKISTILQDETKIFKDVALARVAGGDFAIFMSQVTSSDVKEMAENIILNVSRLAVGNMSHSDNIAHIGGVYYEHSPTLSNLLAEADNSLQAARQKGPNKWLIKPFSPSDEDIVQGKSWWRKTLAGVLEDGNVILYSQPVISNQDDETVLHHELLSRIPLDSGTIENARIFVPIAERMQLISKLDQVVLRKIFDQQSLLKGMSTVAVNVSPSSLADSFFVEWLFTELSKLKKDSPQLIFEFPEFGAVQHLDTLKTFSTRVQKLGHAIGLDHFGQSFSNFGYLKSLRPKYVKIDRGFTRELESDHGDSGFFIEALAGVAHSLDIQVIAEGVETKKQQQLLLQMNIDALQGYLFAKPSKLS